LSDISGVKDKTGPATPLAGWTERQDPLPAALSRIARIISETLELKEVFAQVAEAASEVLPYETMGVCRFEPPNTFRLYAIAGDTKEKDDEPESVLLDDFSPAMRPRPGVTLRFDDARLVCDPQFLLDRMLLDEGVRSALATPLMGSGSLAGQLWFTATRSGVFEPRHEEAARAIADILSLSLEHERLWSLDAARRRRLDAIDSLMSAIAETLDVRGIFDRVSQIVRPVLPHDHLILTSLSADGSELVVEATSGEPAANMPARFLKEKASHPDAPEYALVPDVEAASGPCAARSACRQFGMRSLLGMPLHVEGSTRWLVIVSRTPNQYSEQDVIVARRIADHVSLALSHQRLAEEERAAAEARERAAHLEERVAVLRD